MRKINEQGDGVMASREMNSQTANNGRLAMVTGASSGIGYELAILCAKDGFNLLVVADDPKIEEAAKQFQNYGVDVDAVQADLATREGVDKFYNAAQGRQVDVLLANADTVWAEAFSTRSSTTSGT